MDLKQELLKLLEENRGSHINGAGLASELMVTRSAVWKAVKGLQKDGYEITATPNKGYQLSKSNDIISIESITPLIKSHPLKFTLDLRDTVTSTNTIAKELAAQGAPEGTVIIAREQTAGRGRMGRAFYSPHSTGIYLSIILRPNLVMEDALFITTATAVAVTKAIEKLTNQKPLIKWVNDIYINEKKVCGILTEASLNFETGGLEYAVVGIGLNVSTSTFPDDIHQIAGSIFHEKPQDTPITSILVAEVLNQFALAMDTITDRSHLKEYRDKSFLLGKEILVLKGSDTIPATALDIDDNGRLVVKYEDSTIEALSSGEVSTKAR